MAFIDHNFKDMSRFFVKSECGLWRLPGAIVAPAWCYDVKLESRAVVMMSVLHTTDFAQKMQMAPTLTPITPQFPLF